MKNYESPELLLKVYALNTAVATVSEVEGGELGVDGNDSEFWGG